MKSYHLDGHKLMYHPERISEFLLNKDCFPLYMEISPVGSCNHRCIFCAYDYIGHPNRKLDTDKMIAFIDQVAQSGLKSLLVAGEGEPLLHPDIGTFITHAKAAGIDVGMFTNGELLDGDLAAEILPSLTFIRFSFNGGNAENYAAIHKVKPKSFNRVLDNIRNAAEMKRREGLSVDIGAQFVLLPENVRHLSEAVSALRDAGVEYLAAKPFIQLNRLQSYQMQERMQASEMKEIFEKAETAGGQELKVVVRQKLFEAYGRRTYSRCYGTSFISVLNSAGDIATCLPYWDKAAFVFGNIYASSFQEIWKSKNREQIKKRLEQELNVSECPPHCRAHEINEYLFELKHPSLKHINFI